MTSTVICFSGRIASGKTTVSKQVAEHLKAEWAGFGDVVRAAALARSLDASSRTVLQELGAQLIQDNGIRWLCEQVIVSAKGDSADALVIDGVRHVDVLHEIKSLLPASSLLHVHLSFDGAANRGRNLEPSERSIIEQHSTERDVVDQLPRLAHLVVDANQPADQVVETIMRFVRPIMASTRSASR